MRSQDLNLVKLTLLVAFFIGLFCPGVMGLDQLYTVPSDPGASCWASSTGSFFDTTYFISLTRPETDTATGLVFQYFNTSRSEKINNATLRLYFDIEFDPGSSLATVYGFDQALGPSFFATSGQLLSAPLTDHYTNINLTGISSPGWVEIDVTDIIQEIVNRPYWYLGDNLGLVILGAGGQPHRTIVSNNVYPTRWPQLNVTWGEAGGMGAPGTTSYVEQYREYDVYAVSDYYSGVFIDRGDVTLYSAYPGQFGLVWEDRVMPFTDLPDTGETIGVYVNGLLYFAGQNSTGALKLWTYDSLNDVVTFVANWPSTSGTAWEGWTLVFYPPENRIYLFHCDTGGIYTSNYDLDTSSMSTRTTLYTGFGGYTSAGLVALTYEDYIFVAGSTPSSTSSLRKVRFKQYDGVAWSGTYTIEPTGGTQTYWPAMAIDYEAGILALIYEDYQIGTSRYIGRYHVIGDAFNVWSATDNISPDASNGQYSMGIWDPVTSTAYFTWSNSASDVRKETGYFESPLNYFDNYGSSPANYTGHDILCTTPLYFNESRAWFIVNVVGVGAFYKDALSLGSYYPVSLAYWDNPITTGTFTQLSGIQPGLGTFAEKYYIVVNGTLTATNCTTIECVEAYIDQLEGGADPLEPDPPGWDQAGDPAISRQILTLMFLSTGIGCLFIPSMWMIYKKAWHVLPIVIFLIIVGLALLWSLPTI